MSDDLSKVDWTRPIEAVSKHDGSVRSATVRDYGDMMRLPSVWVSGFDFHCPVEDDGTIRTQSDWCIRNVAEPVQAASDAITLTAAQAAMLRKVLAAIGGCVGTAIGHQTFFVPAQVVQDARDALALLPEPVDADEAEIDRLIADFKALGTTMTKGQRARFLARAALARGRALERDSREG